MSDKILPSDRDGWQQPSSSRGGTCTQWQAAVQQEVVAEGCYSDAVVEWIERYIGRPGEPSDSFLDVGDLRSELQADFGTEFGADTETPEGRQRAQRLHDEALCLIQAAAARLPDKD